MKEPKSMLSKLTIVFLLVSAGIVFGEAAEAGVIGKRFILLPIRWCAVEGSPAAFGEPGVDIVLLDRLRLANTKWAGAGSIILLRSAFTAGNFNGPNTFPTIADPNPNIGRPGDIINPNTGNTTEWEAAKAACAAAWDKLGKQNLIFLQGPIAINANHMVDVNGIPTDLTLGTGWADYPTANPSANACVSPFNNFKLAIAGDLLVPDYSQIRDNDPGDAVLAHEFGHVLGLGHGNGKDDDGDGLFDDYCDSKEVAKIQKNNNLMNVVTVNTSITGTQKFQAAAFALSYPHTMKDPPLALLPGDTSGLQRPDAIHDVPDRFVDMTWVSLTHHTPSKTTIISHGLIDLIPSNTRAQYLVFADLDNNPATGGAPADLKLGVETAFQGAELVTQVTVLTGVDNPSPFATARVWKFQNGAFVEVNDPSIQAGVGISLGGETNKPQFAVVSIEMSDAVRGPVGTDVRINAFAQSIPFSGGDYKGSTDSLNDESIIDFVYDFRNPRFPIAGVTPAQARPGQTVTVEAIDLIPNRKVEVFLGVQKVGSGSSDKAGNVTLNVKVPFDAPSGFVPISVVTVGTALTADSAMEVIGEPMTPVFGPKQFTRTAGPPNSFIETFQHCGTQQCQIVVKNGNDDGTKRISGATISLNGAQIIGPGDFNQKVGKIAKPVVLTDQDQLTIKLASKPEGFITVDVECAASPVILSAVGPGASLLGSTLLSAVTIINTGTSAAENVRVTEIILEGGKRLTPSLPFKLGGIPKGGSAVLDANFSGKFAPRGSYPLTIKGKYAVGSSIYCFTLATNLVVPSASSSASTGTIILKTFHTSGARLPIPPGSPGSSELPDDPSFRTIPRAPFVSGPTTAPPTVVEPASIGEAGEGVIFKVNNDISLHGFLDLFSQKEPGGGASGGGMIFVTFNPNGGSAPTRHVLRPIFQL